MKFRWITTLGLVCAFLAIRQNAWSIPDPPDTGGHFTKCLEDGSAANLGQLNWVTTNLCYGSVIILPTNIVPTTFNPGEYGVFLEEDPVNPIDTGPVPYTAGSLYFESLNGAGAPAISYFTNYSQPWPPAGIYRYAAKVDGIPGGICSKITVIIANVTIVAGDPNADSDYDGVLDCQEFQDGTDPFNPQSVLQKRLGHWRFDNTNSWVGEQGQTPIVATGISGVASWYGFTNAVRVNSPNPAALCYREVEPGAGIANINLRCGTVRFWFKPDWSSTTTNGSGPGSTARLIEMGQQTTGHYCWALLINSSGTQISSCSAVPAQPNLYAPINWVSNQWHQVALTYYPSNSFLCASLYVDGQPIATTGLGLTNYPNASDRSNGFRVGSDQNGNNQARGVFEELKTFNYPLSASDIAANYLAISQVDTDGDGLTDIQENELGTDPLDPDTNGNGIPDGWEVAHGSNPLAPVTADKFKVFIVRPNGLSPIP